MTDDNDHRAAVADGALPTMSVQRADDLLSLKLEFINLRLSVSKRQLTRCDAAQPAFLIVHLQPQHLAEQAFEAGPLTSPPIGSRLSGPSRLAFRLRGNVSKLDFSLASLLTWTDSGSFEQSLVPQTRRAAEIADGAPQPSQTAIEAPYRLFISPETNTDWHAETEPVRQGDLHNPRIELWHVRLAAVADGTGDTAPANIRAVWSPDFHADGSAADDANAFDTPLRKHYTEIIQRTHQKGLDPEPVAAHQLMLSALGAWLDLDGPSIPGPDSVSLDHWTQRTTFGQDQRVVTENKGYLLPTGHPASLVEVTERIFETPGGDAATADPAAGGSGAYLRTQTFIRIKSPQLAYDEDWRLPVTDIRVLDTTTPALEGADPGKPFWIKTRDSGHKYAFRASLRDCRGESSGLSFFAMFVPGNATDEQIEEASREYADAGDCTIDMQGQAVTVAKSTDETNLNARLELLRLRLAAARRAADPPPGSAAFTPIASALQARVPGVREFVADGADRDWFELVDPHDKDNTGQVFLRRRAATDDTPIALNFGGGKIGSLILPNMDVAGLSHSTGVCGDVAPLMGGKLDPAAYFKSSGPREALLLGSLPLAKIVAAGATDPSALPLLVLRGAAGDNASSRTLRFEWSTTALTADDPDRPVFIPGDEGSLMLSVVAVTGEDEHAVVKTRAEVSDYRLRIELAPGLGMEFIFDQTSFTSGPGQPPGYDMGLVDIEMTGVIMQIIEFLAKASAGSLEKKKKDSGFAFQVTVKSDRIQFKGGWGASGEEDKERGKTKDVLEYGPLWFYNVGVSLGVTVFFEQKPVEISFGLASPGKPFFITSAAGLWGGGGSFGVTVTTRAAVKVRFSIQAGFVRAFKIGEAKGRIMATAGLLFTYTVDDDKWDYAFIITVAGGVKLSDAIKVSLSIILQLVPVDATQFIGFDGEVKVALKVKIVFFTYSFSFKYSMFIPGPGGGKKTLASGAGAIANFENSFSRDDWIGYQRAFAV